MPVNSFTGPSEGTTTGSTTVALTSDSGDVGGTHGSRGLRSLHLSGLLRPFLSRNLRIRSRCPRRYSSRIRTSSISEPEKRFKDAALIAFAHFSKNTFGPSPLTGHFASAKLPLAPLRFHFVALTIAEAGILKELQRTASTHLRPPRRTSPAKNPCFFEDFHESPDRTLSTRFKISSNDSCSAGE